MRNRILLISFIFFVPVFFVASLPTKEKNINSALKLSEESEACLDCHSSVTPGIVEDWQTSLHSKINLQQAISKPELEKRVSSNKIQEKFGDKVIGCYECHSLNADSHKDNFDHFGYRINVIVSPNDCSTCHPIEATQYSESKKANAIGNLEENPVYHTLVETITSTKEFKNGKIVQTKEFENARSESCYACHGTKIEVKGMRSVETDLGEIEIPNLSNWPNHGVGRINPDGSKGACTSCHPRHSFSIEIARKPYTCGQCHLEPDVPAYNVYKESKHGNIFESKKEKWNWTNVPWTVGKDFSAPTCTSCHNSLLVNSSGDIIAERSHDFGSRLWTRLFGLIYAHPQPKNGNTSIIRNKDGLLLPTTFTGENASEFLISKEEQSARIVKMSKVCQSCHSTTYATNHFKKLDKTIEETNKMTLTATQLLLEAWNAGLANKNNPFDETIEIKWIKQWLLYSNSIRYASAMSGPDYAAFKNGWWDLSNNLAEMKDWIEVHKKIKK